MPARASRSGAPPEPERRILALSGGVGGAKLAQGLYRVLPPERLTVVANTGDDFRHLGLQICPDLDTLMYTLAGIGDPERGWGLAGESWRFLAALEALGGAGWFRLGDRDLATHVYRGELLRAGRSLSEATAALCAALGVRCRILPMSDQRVSTVVHTGEGALPFQRYFVERRCEPAVTGFEFEGIERARPQPELLELSKKGRLAGVVLCPSNPFVSMGPILAVPGLLAALRASGAPLLAVSPIVAGRALKGPAAKMMAELGLPVSAAEVARHYQGRIDCFVLDESDATLAAEIEDLGMEVAVAPTVMHSLERREQLARRVVALLEARR